MQRFDQKVKDLVDIRAFSHGPDLSDPATAIDGYRFTEITSELLVKWLDGVAHTSAAGGTAAALAGFRGVGKSHFLSVFGAVMARADLRSSVTDEHVRSAIGRLSRRGYTVVQVRRGTAGSLVDELRNSVAEALSEVPDKLPEQLHDLLVFAVHRGADLPLIVLVDSAAGRETRVARDDGAVLAELADAARLLGFFVGVALDDDIAGADGANSAIATRYSIDYLDQEHLYGVINNYLFVKQRGKRPVLHDIYTQVKGSLPGFRWSEQRFSALYPLHPACFELAPLIRLYIQDFSLLSFAAEAATKIAGRPANSLVGLDELFDTIEKRLRRAEDLKPAFTTYDLLEHDVIDKAPFNVRLQSKLILKGLFLLSLREKCTTGSEIAASMMLPQPVDEIDTILNGFAAAGKEAIERSSVGSGFLIRMTEGNSVESALDQAAADISEDEIWQLLVRHMAERFADGRSLETGHLTSIIEWRGSVRRGEIVLAAAEQEQHPGFDWRIVVGRQGDEPDQVEHGLYYWCTAELTADEVTALRRACAMARDAELAESSDRAALTLRNVHALAVERIWKRTFVDDAVLRAAGFDIKFDEEAGASQSLGELLTRIMSRAFELLYPAHPNFGCHLGPDHVSKLVISFFGGHDQHNQEIQRLARDLCLPLGLATQTERDIQPASADDLAQLDVVKATIGDPAEAVGVTRTDEVAERMRRSDLGLSREAVHLVLAALVAQRNFEFVTTDGNRISHRSLDLQLIWDDIIGIALPSVAEVSSRTLVRWAELLTGIKVGSLHRPGDVTAVRTGLEQWLDRWDADRMVRSGGRSLDEGLNVSAWEVLNRVRQTFGEAALVVGRIRSGELSLEDGIKSITEVFSNSEHKFHQTGADIVSLREIMESMGERRKIERYLALAQNTGEQEIEQARKKTLDALTGSKELVRDGDELTKSWQTFRSLYSAYYAARHDEIVGTYTGQSSLREIQSSDVWSSYETWNRCQAFDPDAGARVLSCVSGLSTTRCNSDTVTELQASPTCTCGFDLEDTRTSDNAATRLLEMIEASLGAFRRTVLLDGPDLTRAAELHDDHLARSVEQILETFSSALLPPPMQPDRVSVLERAYALLSESERVLPHDASMVFADEVMV